MSKTVDRLLVLGLDGATWSVLDPMRSRGLMPNLDALLSGAAHGTLRSIIPAGHDGRVDDDDDRLRTRPARCLRPPVLRRRRRPNEGQSLGPDPRAHGLAPALRGRAIDRFAQSARAIPPDQGERDRRLGHGCAAPASGLVGRPRVCVPACPRRRPTTAWVTSGSGHRNLSKS